MQRSFRCLERYISVLRAGSELWTVIKVLGLYKATQRRCTEKRKGKTGRSKTWNMSNFRTWEKEESAKEHEKEQTVGKKPESWYQRRKECLFYSVNSSNTRPDKRVPGLGRFPQHYRDGSHATCHQK